MRLAPSVRAADSEARVDGLDREADRAHHQRKSHDRRGERGARSSGTRTRCPAARGARRSDPGVPKSTSSAIADDDRRQHERQVHDGVEERLAGKVACARARRRPRWRRAGSPRAPEGDLQAEREDLQLSRGSASVRARRKPNCSKVARACGRREVGARARLTRASVDASAPPSDRRSRRMRARGERIDDAHALVGHRVGAIDDAERRFAARDQRQRGAHVVRRRRPCPRSRVHTPSAANAAFAYLPAGTASGLASAMRPSPRARGDVHAGRELHLHRSMRPARSARGRCRAGSCACRARARLRCST